MDRLISLEPSNLVVVRIEHGQKCYGELTLRNVMYTMPVAFRLQPMNKGRYTVKTQSGIIAPLGTLTLEIVYHVPSAWWLPGAAIKYSTSGSDTVPNDWFTTMKKQVFIDSGIKIMFVGSPVLVQLVMDGSMNELREVFERSDPTWKPADSVDSQGQSLLHIAIAQSRPDIVQILLEFEPDIEFQSRSGSTPLEAASGCGEELIVELLLAHKASPDRSESSSRGPIHLATIDGYFEVLRLLLLKGANIDALTKDGNTALHLAVKNRRRDCTRLLLANSADTGIRNTRDGDTALHIAAKLGDEQMVKLLLQKGVNKDIRNKAGKTAYDLAAGHGHVRLFDALKLGDNFCLAARKGDVRAIQRLIENGAAIDGRDQHGWTALHQASFKGRTDTVKMLIDKGIDINSRDEDGYTALHCAVESGHAEVVELLVKKGADVESRTNKGVTPLQIADSLHYAGISRILIYGGATTTSGMPRVATGQVPAPFEDGKIGAEAAPMKRRLSKPRAVLESDGSKENQSPLLVNSPVSFKSTASLVKPCSKKVTGNPKEPFSMKLKGGVCREEDKKRDEKKIDMEIEEIEKEMGRLSSKLDSKKLNTMQEVSR
ncbi:FH protein interacting protein FIP2-like [Hibiscus syriacus]|uniref:FH protein interacting protein FIP2-like n=1 Tax=Hibiscus syriacus TaxID=106335 RepID=A0A6A2Y6L5_HIBSY|nr:FH protein interacting protein FIP2-like [Hibiscus syriacus]